MAAPSETRRALLRAAGLAVAAGLAGCTGTASENEPSATATTTATEDPTTPASTSSTTPTAAAPTPHSPDAQHLHGTMVVRINGRTYHVGDKPWNMEERTGIYPFHFHTDNERDTWHVHAMDVTLGYAIDTMPKLEVAPPTIAFRGNEYDGSQPGTSVSVLVNGEPIEAIDRYVLQEGDAIEVVVETDADTPTPTATPESPATDVSFRSSTGTSVAGTRYGDGPCGVVLVPQIDRDRGSWEPQATALADGGAHALAIDGGDRPADAVLGAASYLREEQGAAHVVLVGASAGGEAAIEAAAREPDAVDGLVALSPSGGEDVADDLDGRLLVVASRDDEERFVDAANEIYANADEPKRLELFEGDAHGQALFEGSSGDRVMDLIVGLVGDVCG